MGDKMVTFQGKINIVHPEMDVWKAKQNISILFSKKKENRVELGPPSKLKAVFEFT